MIGNVAFVNSRNLPTGLFSLGLSEGFFCNSWMVAMLLLELTAPIHTSFHVQKPLRSMTGLQIKEFYVLWGKNLK